MNLEDLHDVGGILADQDGVWFVDNEPVPTRLHSACIRALRGD